MLALALLPQLILLSPPPEYDYEPKGGVKIIRPSDEETQRICNVGRQYPIRVVGCMTKRKPCTIVLGPRSVDECMIPHERAHCNGWPDNHPGATRCGGGWLWPWQR